MSNKEQFYKHQAEIYERIGELDSDKYADEITRALNLITEISNVNNTVQGMSEKDADALWSFALRRLSEVKNILPTKSKH